MPSLTSTSKFLALILRHKPQVVGITLDKNGWANIDDLLIAMNKQEHLIDKQLLDRIVATDDKKRYEYDSTGTKIRASQGHSLKDVDLQLEPKTPPDKLYHGTATRFLAAIMTGGLLPQNRQYVHFSSDVNTAIKVGQRHGEPVILIIDTKKMYEDGYMFYLSNNGIWLTKKVPREYIRIVELS